MTTITASAAAIDATTTRVLPVYRVVVADSTTGRIRVRACSLDTAETAVKAASSQSGRCIRATHGGGVANAYGYPAETEAEVQLGLVCDSGIFVGVWRAQLPANKVTVSGAAAACTGRRLFDGRFREERLAAQRDALEADFRDYLTRDHGEHIGYVAIHGGEVAFGCTPEAAIEAACERYEAVLS